jgi:hypothetical protein
MGMKPRNSAMETYTVICQGWEESEAGWGIRPDGFSLHLTLEDRDVFAQEFWTRQKEFYRKEGISGTPKNYNRQSGRPFETIVNQAIYDKIVASENGIRCWHSIVDWKKIEGVPWPASSGWKTSSPPRLDKKDADVA